MLNRSSLPFRGTVKTAFGIIKEEGVTHLYRGLTAQLARQMVYTSIRMNLYDWIRNLVKR